MTQLEATLRWKKSALEDLRVAEDMLKLHHFDWALYLGHLVLEKLLKGLITHVTNDAPPYIHDLKKLSEVAKLPLTSSQNEDFQEITTFHIKARYDNVKNALYKKATKEYAEIYIKKIKEYALWIQHQY
jgi:HEPN domain-containing protein